MGNTIIYFDITLMFKTKGQMVSTITWLTNEDIEWCFTKQPMVSGEDYSIDIHDMCWANNMKRLAKHLCKIDDGRDY